MTNSKTCCLPVVVIITEETASGHINVLLLFLFLLLLLLSGGGSSGSSSSGSRSSSSGGDGDKLLQSSLDQLLDVLSLKISKELLNLLLLSLSTDGLEDVLDISSLIQLEQRESISYSGRLVSTENKQEVSAQMSHLQP